MTAALGVVCMIGGSMGCITRYRYPDTVTDGKAETPPAPPSIPAGQPFPVGQAHRPRRQDEFFINQLQAYSGRAPTEAQTPPATGHFVSVTAKEVPNSMAAEIWGIIALVTVFILPVYSDTSGYDLTFETFIDGRVGAPLRVSGAREGIRGCCCYR